MLRATQRGGRARSSPRPSLICVCAFSASPCLQHPGMHPQPHSCCVLFLSCDFLPGAPLPSRPSFSLVILLTEQNTHSKLNGPYSQSRKHSQMSWTRDTVLPETWKAAGQVQHRWCPQNRPPGRFQPRPLGNLRSWLWAGPAAIPAHHIGQGVSLPCAWVTE